MTLEWSSGRSVAQDYSTDCVFVNMKGDAALDYAEFQLTPTRTRCELFVSAEGATEKLASGFLKPFVTHLRALEVQVARGSQVVRLERHPNLSRQTESKWFNKGTFERFVRFVSTPEVIERVKTIEDELAQLEQVRCALANTFGQTEDRFASMEISGMDTSRSLSGAYQESDGTPTMPRIYSMDTHDKRAEASKIELLRAIDVRLMALRQEQDLAFSLAAAAGFDNNNLVDLVTFAEHFGADRLGAACLQCVTLSRKRKVFNGSQDEIKSASPESASSGSDMSLASGNESELAVELEVTSHMKSRNSEMWLNGQRRRTEPDINENTENWGFKMSSQEKLDSSLKNSGIRTRRNTDSRRRWGPPERIQIGCPSPEVHLQGSIVAENVTEVNKCSVLHAGQDDSKSCDMIPLHVGDRDHSTLHLGDCCTLSQQGPTVFPNSNPKHFLRHSAEDRKKGSFSKGGPFFYRLQHMAQQVEKRRPGEDLQGSFHSSSMGSSIHSQLQSGPQVTVPDSPSMWLEPAWISSESSNSLILQASGDQVNVQSDKGKSVPARSPVRSSSLPARKSEMVSVHLLQPSSVDTQGVHNSPPQAEMSIENSNLKKLEVNCESEIEKEDSKTKDNKEEVISTSVRRLSVQDAINLFESKKKGSDEIPIKKLVKQDSCKGSLESGDFCSSEKAVLRRWSGTNLTTSGESCMQEKMNVLDSKEVIRKQGPQLSKDKDGDDMDASTDRKSIHCNQFQSVAEERVDMEALENRKTIHGNQSQPVTDDHVKERHKKSAEITPQLIQTWQSERSSISTMSEADTPCIKQQSAIKQTLRSNSFNGPISNQQKTEVANRFTRGARDADAVGAGISSRAQADSANLATSHTTKPLKDREGQSIVNNLTTSVKEKTEKGKRNLGVQNVNHLLPILGTPVSNGPRMATQEHRNAKHRTMAYLQEEKVTVNGLEIARLRETADQGSHDSSKSGTRKVSGQRELNLVREHSANLGNIAVDLHMQALVKMVDNQYQDSRCLSGEDFPSGYRGRFYVHYARMRDAWLREKPTEKRAEKEAKLKLMQETLDRCKAQMLPRTLRSSKKNTWLPEAQQGAEKLQKQKHDLFVTQKEQASDNQASPLKPGSVKKPAPSLSKLSTSSRTSIGSVTASSPSPIPKNAIGTHSQWKSPTSNYNIIANSSSFKSAPNLADSRKEINMPSSVRTEVPARIHAKAHGHSRTGSDLTYLTENGNIIMSDDALSITAGKVEMKRQLFLTRKGSTCAESKSTSAQALDAMVSKSFKAEQEGVADSFASMTLTQEVRPFLRKGQGISLQYGPGVMTQKASDPVEVTRSTGEEVPIELVVHGESVDSKDVKGEVLEAEHVGMPFVAEEVHPVSSNSLGIKKSINNGPPSVFEDQPDVLEVEALNYELEDASCGYSVRHATVCRDDVPEGIKDPVSVVHGSFLNISNLRVKVGGNSSPLSQQLAQSTTESVQNDSSFVTPSSSFRASSPPNEHSMSPDSSAVASPAHFSMLQPGTTSYCFSPPPVMSLDSPLGSPASRNTAQNHTNLVPPCRKLSGPQKPAQPPKEAVKGFKRLLHFGRKSRSSETANTDCVSAFTTSEGDDDADEARGLGSQPFGESVQRIRMWERGIDARNTRDHYEFRDQGATQLLRSSIPAAPANFKLREDHLSGGTLLKAPRSFFSLSSFRSRGNDAKSR